MNELLSQLVTPEIQAAFTFVIILLAVLYVLSIVWVVRDAYLRGTTWYIWAIIALVPLAGVIAYCLLRPPLLQIDRDEQELEIALKQRELRKYGECANCGYPVENDYILCPNCHQRLKNLCMTCNHALEPSWSVCPYCATPASGQPNRRSAASSRQAEMKVAAKRNTPPPRKERLDSAGQGSSSRSDSEVKQSRPRTPRSREDQGA